MSVSKTGLPRRVFVLGGHISKFIGKGNPDFIDKKHADFGKRENPTLEHYIHDAVNQTLKNTGVDASLVQKAIIGNFASDLFNNQGHLGAMLVAAHPGLQYVPAWHVEGACASGGLAYSSALESILAGSDIVMAVGAEMQTSVSPRVGGDYLARASHYATQRGIDDFTFPALFARRMKAYCEAHGVTPADIAPVSVKAYANGNKNPLAHMHAAKMTLERAATANEKNPNFLGNPELNPWLKPSDCSQVTDGGAGLILVSEAGLKALGRSPADCIEVMSVTVAADALGKDGDLTEMGATAHAARKALAQARVSAADIQVAEMHDCFNIAEVLGYEAIGWAPKGKGHLLAKEGVTAIDGKHPVNTGGGLISFGHPVGATGLKQVMEVFRQMKGKCEGYQVGGADAARWPKLGLTVNMGGDDKTVVSSVFRNVE
jgi:acetyl-CoA acyltransferase